MSTGHFPSRRRARNMARRSRGSMYVFVLLSGAFVVAVGLAGLAATRVRLRTLEATGDQTAARLYARSAIQLGLAMIRNDPTWRTTLGNGAWIAGQSFDRGSIDVEALIVDDGDGDPLNDDLVLTASGRCGTSVHRTQVRITSDLVIAPGSWRQALAGG